MPLLCPDCANLADEDEPYCSRCGHDLVWSLRHRSVGVVAPRREVVVDRFRVDCVCYGEVLRFDPVAEEMSSRFQCSHFRDRIDCVACPICPKCGQLSCTCRFLGIKIEVKTPPTIETVALRGRVE